MLPDLMEFRQEIDFLWRCAVMRQKLRKIAGRETSRFDGRLCRSAGDTMISTGVIENLRLHAQMVAICRAARPTAIITLYEGHAWERCVWHAARSVCPHCLCVGYQHTAFRKRSHAVKRSMAPHSDYDPDLVLTLGEVTHEILENSEILTRTLIFGTHRRTGTDAAVDGPRREPSFLVLPEGDEFECIYLFELAMECAVRLPDVEFIFRTHPYYTMERLEERQKWHYRKIENVVISHIADIEKDFARAGYLLYRGSSTAIYAILFGLKPFYFERVDEMNFDPLFGISVWRENVSSVDDLVCQYRSDRNRVEKERFRAWKEAREYCDKYVQPIRKGTIQNMMDIAGNGRHPQQTT